ncbi:MAG TPA: hypothetical protein VM050_06760 [Patescibacteria group bacterium]|nr:hypothetical protein [Patescibacteria group bacterium]
MAYNRNRALTFGVAGIVIAALLILVFIPAKKEIGINPIVALQEIPDYGFQVVKISEEQSSVVHLNVTLNDFEVRMADGEWTAIEVPGVGVSFDLIRSQEVSFTAEVGGLGVGNYGAIRFHVIRGLEFTNATLDDGEVIGVDVPDFKVEFTTSFENVEGTGSLSIAARRGSGLLSNYMLPQYHMSLAAFRLEFTISPT